MKITISINPNQNIATAADYTGTSGLYSQVELSPMSEAAIKKLCETAEIHGLDDDLHCTVMYCKENTPEREQAVQFSRETYTADAIKLDWWEGHDKQGYLVLQLKSPELSQEHERLVKLGCEATFDDYKPHITICHPFKIDSKQVEYKIKIANMSLRKSPMSLVLVNQKLEDLRDD